MLEKNPFLMDYNDMKKIMDYNPFLMHYNQLFV